MHVDQSSPASDARRKADWTAPIWAVLREHLESVKAPINRAIRDTPPPIPCCDARFNHLLEERSGIARELNRLEALSSQDVEPGHEAGAIADFLRSSAYIDADLARTVRERLNEALAAPKA